MIGTLVLWAFGFALLGATLKVASDEADKMMQESTEQMRQIVRSRNAEMEAAAARAEARRQRQREIQRIEAQRQRQLQSRPVITECVINGVRTFDQTGHLCQQQQ